MNRHSRVAALVATLLVLPAASGISEPAEPAANPLARAEFDQELSFEMSQAHLVSVFRRLATTARVPFVLDFEEDPALEGTFNVRNMSIRAILVSIASSNGLEYSMTERGVVVRRTGMPGAAKPITVGSWPGIVYALSFLVRSPEGRVLSQPRIRTVLNHAAEVKQGLSQADGDYILTFTITPKRQTAAGLELEMKFVDSRPSASSGVGTRWTESHTAETRTVGRGETVLFRTEAGYEVVLSGWDVPEAR
jgi:hypothetical protein